MTERTNSFTSLDIEGPAIDASETLESDPFLHSECNQSPRSSGKWRLGRLPYTIYLPMAMFLWTMSIIVAIRLSAPTSSTCVANSLPPLGTYETGFATDLEPAREAISLKRVQFTGDLKIDPNGTIYRSVVGTQYVGSPSREVDMAWLELMRGMGVDLVGEEADSVRDLTYQKPGGWYLTGMNVFHQLHCLNKLRKATHPHYYTDFDHEPKSNWRQHLDHCIDTIRQSLQCSADMTMIPVEWNAARRRIVPDLDTIHTCRDFERLKEWSLARNAEKHKIGEPSSGD